MRGAQLIRWLSEERKWEKKMLPGMRAKGAVLRLGSAAPWLTILCEGYATGLSIELEHARPFAGVDQRPRSRSLLPRCPRAGPPRRPNERDASLNDNG